MSTNPTNKNIKSGVDALLKALEAGMFGFGTGIISVNDEYLYHILQTMSRLGLSGYTYHLITPLKMESLDATLKSVSFNDSKIKLFKGLKR